MSFLPINTHEHAHMQRVGGLGVAELCQHPSQFIL